MRHLIVVFYPGEKGDKFIKILEKAFDNTPVEVTILSRPPDASYTANPTVSLHF